MESNKIHIKNRKASFEYAILESMQAGIQLLGTEIKSIRHGNASINEAFCEFRDRELWLINMHIAEYEFGNIANHDVKRPRKLLLKASEIKKWEKKVKEKGLTIIPVLLYINDKGLAKMEIALAQGKKSHDKRDTIKEKDVKRELQRLMKTK